MNMTAHSAKHYFHIHPFEHLTGLFPYLVLCIIMGMVSFIFLRFASKPLFIAFVILKLLSG